MAPTPRGPVAFTRRPVRRGRRLILAGFALGLAFGPSVWCQPAGRSEYEIKAAMLYNFTQFVEWPAGEAPSPQAPLVIGVLGRDPFGPALDAILREGTVAQRAAAVRRFADPAQVNFCHVLFISDSEKSRLPEVLAAVARRGVLTVGDIEGFARAGGMIGFVLEGDKVRFEINPEAARRAGLTVSSKLLKLATVVSGGRAR